MMAKFRCHALTSNSDRKNNLHVFIMAGERRPAVLDEVGKKGYYVNMWDRPSAGSTPSSRIIGNRAKSWTAKSF